MQRSSGRLILGSSSPRRKELLQMTQIPFEIMTPDIEEVSQEMIPKDYVLDLCHQKAKWLCQNKDSIEKEDVLLCCDTIVSYENEILEKPKNFDEAERMLSKLSDKRHQVFTGMVFYQNKVCKKQVVTETQVHFIEIPDELLKAYIQTGDSLDKAGAYGIQGMAQVFVKEIKGSYSNVVGLPVAQFLEIYLKDFL